MKYVVEVGSDATMYIPSFTKFDSGIQELIVGGRTQTQIFRTVIL
jgi:hypothetical protein